MIKVNLTVPPLVCQAALSTPPDTMVLLGFHKRTMFGDQSTVSAAHGIGDRPQLGRHRPCAVFDFGDQAASTAQCPAQLWLGDPGCGAVGRQLGTQTAPQDLQPVMTSWYVPRVEQHGLTLVG
jgi:hypothetical protein